MFATEPSKAHSHLEGNEMRKNSPRSETELYQKGIWEKETSHNNNGQLVDLREDPSHLPEQDQVNNTIADIQVIVISVESWTGPGPDMIHIC